MRDPIARFPRPEAISRAVGGRCDALMCIVANDKQVAPDRGVHPRSAFKRYNVTCGPS